MSVVEVPSADEVMARLRIALAEMGYGDVPMRDCHERDGSGWPIIETRSDRIERAVWWTAITLVYPTNTCWECFQTGYGKECDDGDCQSPDGPARPPRELLVPR